MLQELTITKFGAYDTDKNKKPFLTKDGKPYKKVGIQVDYADYDGKWLSHLAFRPEDPALQLKEGQKVTLKITQKGEYLNFDLPSREDYLEARVVRLERAVESLLSKGSQMPGLGAEDLPPQEDESDIPPF